MTEPKHPVLKNNRKEKKKERNKMWTPLIQMVLIHREGKYKTEKNYDKLNLTRNSIKSGSLSAVKSPKHSLLPSSRDHFLRTQVSHIPYQLPHGGYDTWALMKLLISQWP